MVQKRVNVYGLLTVMVLCDRIYTHSFWPKHFILSIMVLFMDRTYNACCVTLIGCLRDDDSTEISWDITSRRLALTDVSDEQSATELKVFLD